MSEMVPRAELERAVAEERRKRRRSEFILAAVVLVVFVTGGGYMWWLYHKTRLELVRAEAARDDIKAQLETAQQLRTQLASIHANDESARHQRNAKAVAEQLDRCERALRDTNFVEAERTLAVAERLLAQGGADGLKDRIARQRTDLDLLRKLDRVTPQIAPPPREAKQP